MSTGDMFGWIKKLLLFQERFEILAKRLDAYEVYTKELEQRLTRCEITLELYEKIILDQRSADQANNASIDDVPYRQLKGR